VLQLGGAAVISTKRELAMWLAQVLCDVVRGLCTLVQSSSRCTCVWLPA
jgi:hypothetical protein